MPLHAPAPITPDHDAQNFDCQHADLVDWLQRRALANEASRASRTYVVCEGRRVVGYYALAAGVVEHAQVSARVRRNMPSPIPALVLGRLAVDRQWQGRGLGAALLQDAVLRSLNACTTIGARVLLCHAVDEAARRFYLHHGFMPSPVADLTMMLDLAKVADVLGG